MNIQSLVYESEIADAQRHGHIVYCCVPLFEIAPILAYREIMGYRSVKTRLFTGWKEPSLVFINLDETDRPQQLALFGIEVQG